MEDFESRPHKVVSFFFFENEKEMEEWKEQKLRKVLPGCSGGTLPGRKTKNKKGEADEDSE